MQRCRGYVGSNIYWSVVVNRKRLFQLEQEWCDTVGKLAFGLVERCSSALMKVKMGKGEQWALEGTSRAAGGNKIWRTP